MPLPHVGMDAVPFTALPAEFLDNMIENIEYTNSLVEGVPASGTGGWVFLTAGANISSVTANGNRSYNLTCSGIDLTSTVSRGMRVRTTRTVAAPTQCTSLNGSTQYYSKTSPAGMTFTDDFTVSAWVKLSSYPSGSNWGTIASRFNGSSGWALRITNTGLVQLAAFNAGGANSSHVDSYQSIPLNKWVHVAAQLDMSAFTATTTTSYVMLDGVDVPVSVGRGGTSPTALVQAGNIEIGAENAGAAGTFFLGKIAQVAIYSAKVTQATIKASINQALAGTETSLISAYSFNGAITDLNANANNLTANGTAVATSTDSPFGGQAGGSISSTLDYGIVQSISFSTDTTLVVQVPEGCTIPTSGGLSSVSYSLNKAPYGMPGQRGKWTIKLIGKVNSSQSSPTLNTWYNVGTYQMNVPIGEWRFGYESSLLLLGASSNLVAQITLATTSASETNALLTSEINATSAQILSTVKREDDLSLAAATQHYLNLRYSGGTSITNLNVQANDAPTVIYAENAYL